jgi:hypothetical protein
LFIIKLLKWWLRWSVCDMWILCGNFFSNQLTMVEGEEWWNFPNSNLMSGNDY